MRKNAVVCLCITLSLIAGSHLYAQDYAYATGGNAFTTEIPIENGYIAVNNGEIHMEIPLATQAQRGQLPVNESLVYDSRIWRILDNSGYSWQPTNVPNSMGGWRLSTGLTAAPTYSSTDTEYGSCGQGQEQYPTQEEFWDFAWTDPQGTKHQFNTAFYQQLPLQPCAPNTSPSSTSGWALDGSGYYLTGTYDSDTGGVDTTIYDKQGDEVYPQLEDTNGNYMSTDSSGNLVDTLGLTPLETTTSGNQITYSVLTYGGSRANYVVTTETVDYNTTFQENDVAEAIGSFTAIKSIQLPDGSSYSFTYDSGTGAGHYGELTSVTLPSGGVINYTWLNYKDSFQNENRWIWTRVKDGGTTTFQPNTISLCSGSSGCQEKTTVTDPAGNDTVYTFTLDPGTYANAGSWNTGITAYQGPASGGVALKSVNTSYTNSVTSMDVLPTLTEYYAVPQSETVLTSLPDAGVTSKTATTFDSIGANPVKIQQWDYYQGAAPSNPTKQTTYTYSGAYYVNGASVLTQVAVSRWIGKPRIENTVFL